VIYLDYNATTPLAPGVFDAMEPFLRTEFGNPSSVHAAGRRSRAAIDDSRDRFASLLKAKPHEIIFTGGGTESDNLGVIGIALAHAEKGRHVITSPTEHHAVLEAFASLRLRHHFEMELLSVDSNGRVDPADLSARIRPDTTLVSVMSANNETGTLQPIRDLARVCHDRNVLFHSDMIQTFGKEAVDPHALGVDAVSLAAHKFYGPKGAGILFLRSGVAISPLQHGGSHENQRRPGTENVAAIVGMTAAAAWAAPWEPSEVERQGFMRETLWRGIQDACPDAVRNGDPEGTLPNTLNVSFPGGDGELLLIGLDLEGVCVSSGSACMVGSVQPSHVLLAMGVAPDLARATVRFSLGRETKPEDIVGAVDAFGRVWRRLAPEPANR